MKETKVLPDQDQDQSVMFNNPEVVHRGQSEPAATNAPVGRSVHWMGFFIRRRIGFISVHFFLLLITVLFFLVLGRFSLNLTSHIATLLTFLLS
jgi:hypothetical protein